MFWKLLSFLIRLRGEDHFLSSKKETNADKPLASASTYQILHHSILDSQIHKPLRLPEISAHRNLQIEETKKLSCNIFKANVMIHDHIA